MEARPLTPARAAAHGGVLAAAASLSALERLKTARQSFTGASLQAQLCGEAGGLLASALMDGEQMAAPPPPPPPP